MSANKNRAILTENDTFIDISVLDYLSDSRC